MEPIIAYRLWDYDVDHLRSYCFPNRWRFSEPMYGPQVFDDESVNVITGAGGIHAFKTIDDTLAYIIPKTPLPVILGKVALWGKIIEHRLGYRAEFAYPHKLELLIDPYRRCNRKLIQHSLSNNYKCEVEDFEFTGEKIYEYGTKINFRNGIASYRLLSRGQIYWYHDGVRSIF